MTPGDALKVIVILSEGIRGHVNQSRGVAYWLSRLTGAEVLEAEVPQLTGAANRRPRLCSEARGVTRATGSQRTAANSSSAASASGSLSAACRRARARR